MLKKDKWAKRCTTFAMNKRRDRLSKLEAILTECKGRLKAADTKEMKPLSVPIAEVYI